MLSPGIIEARAYQLEAADEALTGSTMLVLPTAAGKTVVAWMVIAERLMSTSGWILVVAPTVALVEQHLRGLSLALEGVEPISITGQNPVAKRSDLWGLSLIHI